MKSPFSAVLTLFLVTLTASNSAALAQVTNPDPSPAPLTLSDQLFKLDSIGFAMPMPEDCNTVYDLFGSIPQGYFHPTDGSWTIRVGTVLASTGRETRTQFMDDLINTGLKAFGKPGPNGQIIDSAASIVARQQNLNIELGPASRFYYRYPSVPQPKTPEDWIIRGRTIVQMVSNQAQNADIRTDAFLVITFECPEPNFTTARSIYETLVSRATLTDPALLGQARGAKVLAGKRFFASLTHADFDTVIGSGIDHWQHLVMPKNVEEGTEEKEIAFRQLRITSGVLSDAPELGDENTPGYLVRLRARSIIEQQEVIIDTEATFFVSRDFKSEQWRVTTVIYDAKSRQKRGSAQEAGFRVGSKMNIIIDGDGIRPTTIKPLIEGDGYISRSLIWLLPRLLTHKQIPANYGFYAYNTAANTIGFREESLDADSDNPDGWRVTSHITADQPPQISYLNAQGETTRVVLPQGQVWKPIELKDLIDLWDSKGLPTGSLAPSGG